ncbi:MAG: ribosomal protein S18-alanine N-acetyltransferase [Myxococcota bacterium]
MIPQLAQATDVAAIAQTEHHADPRGWSEAQVRSHLGHPCADSTVVHIEGTARAHLLALCVADEAEVVTIAVHPQFRRQGLAQALLRDAMARWQHAGVQRVFLEVRTDNAAAIALYGALQFTHVGRRPGYYRDGCDAVVMARPLSPSP